ncbi:MAG: DNA methyltransferase, partial [Promethearchaeota archaeon]
FTNKDLSLQWLNKNNNVSFEINERNEIINVKWITENDIRISGSHKMVNIENPTKESVFSSIDFYNCIIQGNYSLVLTTLSEIYKKTEDLTKPQCVIFSPPIQFQDCSLNYFTSEQFFSFCRHQFYTIKSLMKNTGFIVIHTHESHYSKLKIILDETFGRENYVGTIIWKKLEQSKLFSHINIGTNLYYRSLFDYILIYSKDENIRKFNKFPPEDTLYKNPDNDPRGPWESRPLVASEKSSNEEYTYTFKNGLELTRKFRYARDTLKRYEQENRIHFTKPKTGRGIPRLKIFFSERLKTYEDTGEGGTTPNSLWINTKKYGSIQTLLLKLKDHPTLSIHQPFRTEKVYKNLLYLTSSENDLVLDCFSQLGIVLNSANDLKRKWIGIEPNSFNISRGLIPWLSECSSFKIYHLVSN